MYYIIKLVVTMFKLNGTINQNKNQRIYLFYIFCHQENACPHQPYFLQFPLHLMLLDFHWLKNSKDL